MKEFYNIKLYLNGIDGYDLTIIYENGDEAVKSVEYPIPPNGELDMVLIQLHAKELDLRHRHRKNKKYDSIDDMMLHQRILNEIKQNQPKKD